MLLGSTSLSETRLIYEVMTKMRLLIWEAVTGGFIR